MDLDQVKRAVVTVGKGRGFVVREQVGYQAALVITAAHCLPRFPMRHAFSTLEERTYKNLLAPLGQKPSVWAECLFADPVGDIAVLGSPDNQALSDKADAYVTLMEKALFVGIADTPIDQQVQAWMLSRNNQWLRCEVDHNGGTLGIVGKIAGGMSGSPIINDAGAAIGVVSVSNDMGEGSGARLVYNLPAGILQAIQRVG